MAPVLPSGDATTAIPSVNNPLPKISGGSMAIPSGDKPATKRRPLSRKKTSTTLATVIAAAVSSNDDEPELSNGEDAAKAAIKRVIRTLVNRQ